MPQGLPTGGRRRRHAARWAVAIVVLLAIVLGVVLVAGNGRDGARVAHERSGAASGRVRRPAGSARAAGGDAAIARVLRYTPFVGEGTRRRRVMALTFDDGPSPYTPRLVTILARMRVPATFFVVGQQLRYFLGGLQDELRHGFAVGNHTMNHALLWRLPAPAQRDQIVADQAALRRAGASPPRLFRPPYGAYNRATLRLLDRMRMLMVMWSIDPGDWRRPGVGAIVSAVLRRSRPGAIVILHDGGGDRSETLAALPAIIRGLRRRGYRLVTVPRLLALDPPPRYQHLPPTIGA